VPFDPGVGAEADEEDALAPLGNAIVGGIQHPHHHAIVQAFLGPLGVVVFEAREVEQPFLVLLRDEIRIGQPQPDVLEIVHETAASESLHVLEDEGPRPKLAHGADRLREHISAIKEGAVASSHAAPSTPIM
jgi:hypothetical protein